jgi:hypothetical protein
MPINILLNIIEFLCSHFYFLYCQIYVWVQKYLILTAPLPQINNNKITLIISSIIKILLILKYNL